MHVQQSHKMIDCQWCWAEFEERSGVGRNRTAVDAVIPLISPMEIISEIRRHLVSKVATCCPDVLLMRMRYDWVHLCAFAEFGHGGQRKTFQRCYRGHQVSCQCLEVLWWFCRQGRGTDNSRRLNCLLCLFITLCLISLTAIWVLK